MTPEARRDRSNNLLRQLGLPVAESLPPIEDEAEVTIRTSEEVLRRLLSLWAVAGAANLPGVPFFREFIESNGLRDRLSTSEQEFLFSETATEQQRVHFSWQLEPMYFIAWCAGLVPKIALPLEHSTIDGILKFFPYPNSPTFDGLHQAIQVRSKEEVMDWADLLYRTHWGVREAQLRGRAAPGKLIAGAVMEWHKAVNWMICYEGQDDWDEVGTDT